VDRPEPRAAAPRQRARARQAPVERLDDLPRHRRGVRAAALAAVAFVPGRAVVRREDEAERVVDSRRGGSLEGADPGAPVLEGAQRPHGLGQRVEAAADVLVPRRERRQLVVQRAGRCRLVVWVCHAKSGRDM
ncbi:hypothetical protein THAOC_20795, partial [Thalassiosira oceanica]